MFSEGVLLGLCWILMQAQRLGPWTLSVSQAIPLPGKHATAELYISSAFIFETRYTNLLHKSGWAEFTM